MQTFQGHRAKPTVVADRRADTAERKLAALEAVVERERITAARLKGEIAEIREDRDRWRLQAERLATAIEKLKAPPVLVPPAPVTPPISREASTPADADLLYGVPAIAAAFNLPWRKVYHLKDHHGLPTFKIGGKVCANRRVVAAWIEKHSQGGL